MHIKNLFMTCLLLTGGFAFIATPAAAQEVGSLYYYDLTPEEYRNNYIEWKNFLEYHGDREPCQGYRQPPAGFYMKGCNIYRIQPQQAAYVPPLTRTEQTVTTTTERRLLPIVSTYTVYFDFDRSNLRTSEMQTIDRVAREINTYQPEQVTVSGHADTSGPADYNQTLSQKRAMSVAKMLTSYGIENEVIDKRAYGEEDLAVSTGDNVKLEENRRVVIDFRRNP